MTKRRTAPLRSRPDSARLTSFWRKLLRRDLVERDLDDELRATIEVLVEEKVGHVRDVRAGALLDRLARDLRHAARGFRKNPGLSLAGVTMFALGAGGAIAMFALVNAIVIRPLPFPQADRLVAVKHAAPGIGLTDAGLSSGTCFHYRRHAASFELLACYYPVVRNVVNVALAGPELFALLGVRPIAGRLFTIGLTPCLVHPVIH